MNPNQQKIDELKVELGNLGVEMAENRNTLKDLDAQKEIIRSQHLETVEILSEKAVRVEAIKEELEELLKP